MVSWQHDAAGRFAFRVLIECERVGCACVCAKRDVDAVLRHGNYASALVQDPMFFQGSCDNLSDSAKLYTSPSVQKRTHRVMAKRVLRGSIYNQQSSWQT